MTLINPFEKKLRQVKIGPTGNNKEFFWQCPQCMQKNEEQKKSFSDNHAYTCFDCGYAFVAQNLPDDIKHWLQSTELPKNIDKRPKIIGRS